MACGIASAGLRRRALLCFVLLVSAAAPARVGAADADQIRGIVDGIIQPLMDADGIPGLIVGVSMEGERFFFPYGTRNDEGDPFAPDTLVEIGSCTKVFTTALFAEAVGAGQMALDDPIQRYMPGGMELQPEAQSVSLQELADFSAGMPDLPPHLPRSLKRRTIRHYTTEDFFEFVQSWAPEGPLPAPYLYSNASIGLLGYLVADAMGSRWIELLRSQITGPQQMTDTVIRVPGGAAGSAGKGTQG
jgi:CubicO group peptidase (beta-lactamase class C family)